MNLLLAFLLSAVMTNDSTLVVGALRVMPVRWDKEANFQKLDKYARLAAEQGAQLVVTPEGFMDGYISNDADLDRQKYLAIGEPIDGPMMRRVGNLSRELKIYLMVGFSERRGEQMYNTAALFGPDGKLAHRYSKTHVGSERHNAQGTEFPVVETPLGRWGTLICLDRQLPETSRILAIKGAQLILNPSYGSYGEMNEVMMRTRAYENSVYLAFVHPQNALIIDPKGAIIARDDPKAGDQIVTARITLDDRVGRGIVRGRRPEIYGEILNKPKLEKKK
ncbi:MAG: carbon-nitrogen hydrolase family protein [Blastocatellales bacterium]